jgi:hypothetical protein
MAYARSRSLNALREARLSAAFDEGSNLLLSEAPSRHADLLFRHHPSVAAAVRREILQGIGKFHDGAYGGAFDLSQKNLAEDIHRSLLLDREGVLHGARGHFSNLSVAVGPVAYDGDLPSLCYNVALPKKAAFGDQNAWVTVFYSPQDDLRLSPRCLSPRRLSPRQLSPGLIERELLAERRELLADPRSPVFARRLLVGEEETIRPVGTRSATVTHENRLGDHVESRSFTDAYGDRVSVRSVVDKYGDEVQTVMNLDNYDSRVKTKVDTSLRTEGPLRREVELRKLVNNKSVNDLWMDRFRNRTYQDRLSNDIYGLSRPVFRDDGLARRSGRVLGY